MKTYVSLINWTDQGIRNFRETIDRAEQAQKAAEQMGGALDIYWTVGEYDLVAISRFPDDQTATAFLLQLGALGNVRTKTLTAFGKEEMREIVMRAG